MGILLNLTKEYFKDIEREEDKIELEGVKRVSFTDGNGKFHKNGYQPENGVVLDKLMQALIGRRGNEGDFNDVDTSLITSMNYLFNNHVYSKFNGDISGWEFPKVISMSCMFKGAFTFNQDIGNWKFPQVEYMDCMFEGATAFNQPIGNWEFPKVKFMTKMFKDATNFNQPIGNWKFPEVKRMNCMFACATSFDQDISEWNVNSGIDVTDMFRNCPIKKKNKPKAIR